MIKIMKLRLRNSDYSYVSFFFTELTFPSNGVKSSHPMLDYKCRMCDS